MTSFQLRCDVQSLEKSRSGSIWGSIWIVLEGAEFPEESWNDMPVAFLSEFALVVSGLEEGSGEIVRFFDGPFSVKLNRVRSNLVEVALDGGSVRSDLAGVVLLEDLQAAVRSVVGEVYHSCLELGWSGDMDVRRLQAYAK